MTIINMHLRKPWNKTVGWLLKQPTRSITKGDLFLSLLFIDAKICWGLSKLL